MRRWFLSILFVCPLLFAFSLISRPTQRELPTTSDWLNLLRLSDCELPCWIGVVPGETSVGEAQERVEIAYADTSLYQLIAPVHFWPGVIYKPTDAQLNIAFYSANGTLTEDTVVQSVSLEAFSKQGASAYFPKLSDLQSILGDPQTVRLGSGVENETVALFYKEGRVRVAVNDLDCDEILQDQQVLSIGLI